MKLLLFTLFFFTSLLMSQELVVKAKEFKTDEKTGITVFKGDVNIVKGMDELNASKITIYINKKREPIRYIAQGDVSFFITTKNLDTYKGSAQKVIYLPTTGEYHFFKDVTLKQINNKKTIIGEEVVLKTIDGEAYAKGAKQEPVIMIFNIPNQEEKR
ncbi:MAG: lipopolysaccharide transport periplasmic protein LptA [Campylobacterota bacterium]|nr:lipopolysaccharide transport periplasmic protein LptA [Campylobacterota bacterium]